MSTPIAEMSKFEGMSKPTFAITAFEKIKPYVTGFLTDKHPHRNGSVCPFVVGAIRSNNIYFSYGNHASDLEWGAHIDQCVSFMQSLRSDQTKYGRAIIILLPENFDIETLLNIHVRNKIKCVMSFLMLGALYKESNAKSLHSADFFPLRTPSPTLVIREITAGDLIFLEPSHYNVLTRMKFLRSFIKRFDIPAASQHDLFQVKLARKKLNGCRWELWRHALKLICCAVAVGCIIFFCFRG